MSSLLLVLVEQVVMFNHERQWLVRVLAVLLLLISILGDLAIQGVMVAGTSCRALFLFSDIHRTSNVVLQFCDISNQWKQKQTVKPTVD